MRSKGLEQGTTNLIKRLGVDIVVTTKYFLSEEVSSGDKVLNLEDGWGIKPGTSLLIGQEKVWVEEVEEERVKLIDPLDFDYPEDTLIISNVSTKGIPVPRFKRITYELLEFIRKIRVPLNITLNYGAQVTQFKEKFFVVGIDPGDHSYSLTLREINDKVSIFRRGENSSSTSWGQQSEHQLVEEDIPAYIEFGRSELPLRNNLGYVPLGMFRCIVPGYLQVMREDIISTSKDQFKVSGFDRYTNKNLLTLLLEYDASKTLNISSGEEGG